MTDSIADMLTRIRNASMIHKIEAAVPYSNIKYAIAKVLEREGFITGVEKIEKTPQDTLLISLKYKEGEPVIKGLKRVSKPGRRIYWGYKDIPKVLPSLGVLIVSTPRGLMTNVEAKKQKLGGEIFFEIY